MVYNPLTKTLDEGPDIDFLIKDEIEAINGYKAEMAKTNNPKLIELFKHIIAEEQEHIEELENAKQGNFEVMDSKAKDDAYIVVSLHDDKEALEKVTSIGCYFTKDPKKYKIFNTYAEAMNVSKKLPFAYVSKIK